MGSVRVAEEHDGVTSITGVPEISGHRLGTQKDQEMVSPDPFAVPAAETRSLNEVTPVFKRRVTTELKKFQRNSDDTAGSKQLQLEDITAYNAFAVIQPPYNLDYLAKLYEMSPAHKGAVDAKVANIVGLGYDFQETRKTKMKLEELEGNTEKLKKARRSLQQGKERLVEFVEGLNQEDTFTEIMVRVWRDYETMGNGYLEVGRKKDGSVGYLGHVPAASVRMRRDRDGFVQMISNKAVFFRNFGDRRTANPFGTDPNPNELIHIKKYSPTSGYYGVPDIVAATSAIAGNEFAARFNLDYFSNKAVPRHVIILKGATLSPSTENALLSFFETSLKGQNHRTLYIPLPPDQGDSKVDLKIEPVEAGVQDSSFEKFKKQNLNEILMSHRVPISKIGLAEGVSLAVARDADKTFKEQVCAPEQKIFEKKLNRIFKELTDAFELKLNEMTLTDADTQSKIWERAIKNQWLTPNEVRASQGMPGLKGGDKVLDLKPQQKAEVRASGNRERDAARSAGATDSAGEGRNPQGEGRTIS